MPYIKVYTREPVDKRTYPTALAHSIHFAVSLDGKNYTPLNNNYGILYTEAGIGEQNNILERGARNPKIYYDGCKLRVFADYIDAQGNEIDPEYCWLWVSVDDFASVYFSQEVKKSDWQTDIDTASDVLAIEASRLEVLVNSFEPVHFVSSLLVYDEEVTSLADLDKITAECYYSDGSCDIKPIKWNLENLPEKGLFEVTGEIVRPSFPEPCISGFADPIVYKWEGKWYFLATNDNTGDIGLYASCADTPEELFAEGNYPTCILPYDEARGFYQTFWAPEFHEIGGELYILFAVGNKQWAPQSHMMKLKKGGNILNPDDWCDPVRVRKANGENLVEGEITLDMTYFEAGGRHYVAWSQRSFNPVDSGSMIYIGEIDPTNPYQLISEPTLLTRPLYGWENQSGTVNNEGPYPLKVDGKIYLVYSGGAAGGFSYSLGYLEANEKHDLLDDTCWTKAMTPVLTSYNLDTCEGPGHNGFFVGDDGKLMITYHGQRVGEDGRRNTYIHRVHFGADGRLIFNMSPDRDLPDDKKTVSIVVNIE